MQQIDLCYDRYSVFISVVDSVLDSVYDSVYDSVGNSIWYSTETNIKVEYETD